MQAEIQLKCGTLWAPHFGHGTGDRLGPDGLRAPKERSHHRTQRRGTTGAKEVPPIQQITFIIHWHVTCLPMPPWLPEDGVHDNPGRRRG